MLSTAAGEAHALYGSIIRYYLHLTLEFITIEVIQPSPLRITVRHAAEIGALHNNRLFPEAIGPRHKSCIPFFSHDLNLAYLPLRPLTVFCSRHSKNWRLSD